MAFVTCPALGSTPSVITNPSPRPAVCSSDSTDTEYGYFVAIANQNDIAGDFSTATLGGSNNASCSYMMAVGAGTQNTNSGHYYFGMFIGGGSWNRVRGDGAFVGAGESNQALGQVAFVGAGNANFLWGGEEDEYGYEGGDFDFAGAGADNTVFATYGALVGGFANTVSAGYASAGGGRGIVAGGKYSSVPGGYGGQANGQLSFVAGYESYARYKGSFVWNDYVPQGPSLSDTGANQFVVRASGGTTVYSDETRSNGVTLAPGSGTWESLVDETSATDFASVDDAAILSKVAHLPFASWRYPTERRVRHIGPFASDVLSAFGVGGDVRRIASIDEDGVALSAIKALAAQDRSLEGQVVLLERQIAVLSRMRAEPSARNAQ